MSPAHWLLLDNLHRGWPYTTGLSVLTACDAWLEAWEAGHVTGYGLTPAGLAALLAHPEPVRDYQV